MTRAIDRMVLLAAPRDAPEPAKAVGHLGDAEVLRRAATGDEAACRELVRRHGGRLFKIVHAVHQDGGLAEDVVQETLLRGMREHASLREDSSVLAWLVRIAVRAAIDARRKVRREAVESDGLEEVAAPDESPETTAAAAEDAARVRAALGRLDGHARELMVLRYYGGLSVAELSAVFGKSDVAIRKDLERARAKVRGFLGAWFRP